MTEQEPVKLRPAPSDPTLLLIVGVIVAALGALLLAINENTAVFGAPTLAIGSIIASVGIVAVGVRMGMRAANHEEYLHRLMDAGGDEDDGV